MKFRSKIEALTSDQRGEIAQWRSANADKVPTSVLAALDLPEQLAELLSLAGRNQSRILVQLRLALGITPSSERRNSGDPVGATTERKDKKPRSEQEKLELDLLRHDTLAKRFGNWARRHRRQAKNTEDKLKKLDDIELTPEEEAESETESAEYLARLKANTEKDPSLEHSREAFMCGGSLAIDDEYAEAVVDPAMLDGQPVDRRMSEQRTRYDFSLNLTRLNIDVEKVVIRNGQDTRIISASTQEFGPADSNLAWGFLANLVVLVSQFAMPFNRLGTMLSSPDKTFSSDMLARWFAYVAMRFAPVYLELARQLANAEVIQGDDTNSRVIELTRHLKMLKRANGAEIKAPWAHFQSIEDAKKTIKKGPEPPDLGTLIGSVLPFASDRLDGKGLKSAFHTTVAIGRAVQADPRSNIVFFRSHFGSFGNLLNGLLALRDRRNKTVLIQSDLASVNPVSSAEILEWLKAEYAGCASHARRPFAQHEGDDPDACAYMLHLFRCLFFFEKGLDLHGRNRHNTLAVRGVDGTRVWEEIRELAQSIAARWSQATSLGEGARYIIRHYEKLTRYLTDPRLGPANDFSERQLRPENLIEANANFRWSLNGRFALDINRTVLQTAVAAHAPTNEYVEFVLRADPDDVKANPKRYTPLAYTQSLATSHTKADVSAHQLFH